MDANKPSSGVEQTAPPLPPPPPLATIDTSKESQRQPQQQQHSRRAPLQTNLPDLSKLQTSQQASNMFQQQASTYDNKAQSLQQQRQQQQQTATITTGHSNQAPQAMAATLGGNQQQEQVNFNQPAFEQSPPKSIQPLLAPETSNDVNSSTVINVPTANNQQEQQPSSPQRSIITKVKLSDELNIFDWFRTTDIINQIAERARHSMDSVITALDPGMKEYLYSGGNINIMVICDSENLVSPIRDSFQTAFGRATVVGAKYENAWEYPIRIACGMKEAMQVARERIRLLRLKTEMVPQNQVILVLQPCIVSLSSELKDAADDAGLFEAVAPKRHLSYCMLLEDPVLLTSLSSYSQFIPIDEDILTEASAPTEANFRTQQQLGFAQTIDDLMNAKLRLVPREPGNLEDCQWLRTWAGISESQLVRELSSSLASGYRRKWDECVN